MRGRTGVYIAFLSTIVFTMTGGTNHHQQPALSQPDILRRHVEFLTSTPSFRNHVNTGVLNIVAEYISDDFKKYCNGVKFQDFKVDGREYKNVICTFHGESDERIVIGAHYDVEGEQAGADDNASGVAGLLDLARIVHSSDRPSATIELVAYTLEEPPHFETKNMGSYVHAKSLKDSGAKVKLMLSLEMIGYFSDEADSQSYPLPGMELIYGNVGNFISVVANLSHWGLSGRIAELMRMDSPLPVHLIRAPAIIPGIDYSDHRNYWIFNYPAVMITDTSFYRNPNYHLPTDTADTLDFDRMAQVVNAVFNTVMEL